MASSNRSTAVGTVDGKEIFRGQRAHYDVDIEVAGPYTLGGEPTITLSQTVRRPAAPDRTIESEIPAATARALHQELADKLDDMD